MGLGGIVWAPILLHVRGAIRHYMIFWRLRRNLAMNDKRHVSIDGMDSPFDLVGIKSAKVIKRLAMLRSKHSM